MARLSVIALFSIVLSAFTLAQKSGTNGTSVSPNFGKTAVPFGPKPSGCSSLEILIARGTSEPGPFGLIVGDPLVKNVAALVPGSRGYAVQVRLDNPACR